MDGREYLNSLGINAAATISGYGQSASISGDYLNKGKVMPHLAIFEKFLERGGTDLSLAVKE